MRERIEAILTQTFKPEFLNRLDETVIFHRLSREELVQVVELQLAGLRRRLAELGVTRVDTDARCTFEDDQLFSHRRTRPTGRSAAVTWWEYDRPARR
jgi:ATP-dependent Clp protease ATP-binding subunit ClpA